MPGVQAAARGMFRRSQYLIPAQEFGKRSPSALMEQRTSSDGK
jgi:hypothetical protein